MSAWTGRIRTGGKPYVTLLDSLRAQRVHLAVAGVAIPNEASRRLHLRSGLTELGVFQEIGHKFGRSWDVAWCQQRLAA